MLNIIYSALTSTEKDASNGIPIYTKNYVVNEYNAEISNAKKIYKGDGGYNISGVFVEGMTAGEQNRFHNDLGYMPSYAANELSLMLFGKTVEELIKDMK